MAENNKRFYDPKAWVAKLTKACVNAEKVGTSGKELGFCGGDVQESVRASLHGRDAYKKGYSDGKKAAMDELVRCKDCRRSGVYTSGKLYCKHQYGLTDPKPDDFCSYGERKGN